MNHGRDEKSLREAVLRLAHENRELRPLLLPLVKKGQGVHPDIANLFEGFFSRSKGVKGSLDKAIRELRKGIRLVADALEEELEAAHSGAFEFDPPPYPRDLDQLQLAISTYLTRNYGVKARFAQGFAEQVVRGENY